MARCCGALGADVLALQELDRGSLRSSSSDQPALIAEATGLHVHFAATVALDAVGRYGVALATRWVPSTIEEFTLPESSEPRVAIIADITVPADSTGSVASEFTVAATHLHNDESVALRQLDALLDRLDIRCEPSRGVLLMGDFNCGRAETVPRLAARGFSAVDSPATFPARRPRHHIDWIAGRGLEFTEAVVPGSHRQ